MDHVFTGLQLELKVLQKPGFSPQIAPSRPKRFRSLDASGPPILPGLSIQPRIRTLLT